MSAIEHKTRLYTLIGLALALFLGALDQTIVSTAMPRIVSELSGLERYTWVATIYLLASTLLVPLYGKLADIRSRRSLEIWSVSVFLIGSALCGLAGEFGPLPVLGDGMTQLIIFRGIQGIGGAGIFSLAFIIVSDLYPPRERGKVNGMFGAVFGLSSVLGPLAGGFLTDHAGGWLPAVAGWRWIFYVNLPLGLVALWFLISKMPQLRPQDTAHKLNLRSVVLMMSAFLPLILGLQIDKSTWAWNSPLVLGLLGTGTLMLFVWIWHSLRTEHPVLNLRLFKTRIFVAGNLATFFFGASFLALIIFLPVYMINVQGVSATGAGASIIPMSLGIVLGAGLSGPLVTRSGRYKGIMFAGAALSTLAAILMSTLTAESPMWLVVVYMVIAGIGFGPAQSLYALAIQNAVKPQEIGQATSTVQFSRLVGSTVGAALLGVIFSATLGMAFAKNMPAGSEAFMHNSRTYHHSGQLAARPSSEIRAEIIANFDAQIAKLPAGQDALRSQLEEKKVETADGIVVGIRNSFAEAVSRVWFVTIFIMLGTLISGLFIPNLLLRGKADSPTIEAGSPETREN